MCNKCNSCNKCENKCTCNPCSNCEKELLVQSVTLAGNTLLVVYNDGSQTQTNLQTQVLPLHVSNVVLSNNTLTTTFSDGTTTTSNVTIPNSVVNVGYNNNILTMTFVDGTTSNVGIPFNPNAFVNSTISGNVITYTKQNGTTVSTTLSLPTNISNSINITSLSSTSISNVNGSENYIPINFTSEYSFKKIDYVGYTHDLFKIANFNFKIRCEAKANSSLFNQIMSLADESNSTIVIKASLSTNLPAYDFTSKGVITLTFSKLDATTNSKDYQNEFSIFNLPANLKIKTNGEIEIIFSLFKSDVEDIQRLDGNLIEAPIINGSFDLNYIYI